jgi:hypothetical protein
MKFSPRGALAAGKEHLLKKRFMDSWNRQQTAECADVCR